jgi:hypothetical protein
MIESLEHLEKEEKPQRELSKIQQFNQISNPANCSISKKGIDSKDVLSQVSVSGLITCYGYEAICLVKQLMESNMIGP